MKSYEISKAALGRIPTYLSFLQQLPDSVTSVSATLISKELGLGEVQVRKDLGAVCGAGKPKVGYARAELESSLKRCLDGKNGTAVIIGAGKLGRALLDHRGFAAFGIAIVAAFDRSADENGRSSSGKPILPLAKLPDFCRENNVKLGIIAVADEAAQAACNLLYDSGVKVMWSFSSGPLYKPLDAVVQYENLALSLAHLKMQALDLPERRDG